MESMDRSQLEKALEMRSQGMSCKATSERLKLNNATLDRYFKRYDACGGDLDEALAPKDTGRPVIFAPDEFETALARWYRLSKESLTVAAYFFARDERVRPELREVIEKIEEKALMTGKAEQWPDSVRRAFRVTEEEKDAFRGKKHSQQSEMVTRRGMFELGPNGEVIDILPGQVWEMDDYSANQPFLYKDPQTNEIKVGRQVLAARDLCSPKWLGFDHIGRDRDAYRGEDICRTMERLMLAWGKPKRLRLERGAWESSFIHGIEVKGMETRWGDLRDIVEICHVFKSKGKGGLEGAFNSLQRWLGHTGTDIGRVRGEFEEAAKRLRQVQNTGIDPQSLGFLTQEQSSILHSAAAELINSRPMEREHLDERVAPDDMVARLGWHTTPLKESELWYFRPYKAVRTVRGGYVSTSHRESGWPKMYFCVNGILDGIHFESGHQVLIAYDPARPDLGAWVCNGDASAKNRNGWKMGQLLIPCAPADGYSPQFNYSGTLTPHMVRRKKASAAAATTFRTIRAAAGTPQPSGSRESVAMNGLGGYAKAGDVTRHATAPAAATPAETGPVPDSVRPLMPSREIRPATSSRAMPADPAAEIRRLQASLIED